MTALVPEAVSRFVGETPYATISTRAGIIAIILLIGLLVEKELLRASGSSGVEMKIKALNVAVVPLLMVFVFVLLLRLLDLAGLAPF